MSLTINHQTNDIINSTGAITVNGTAVGGDNSPVWYGSRGVFSGGESASGVRQPIDYITISTTGNAANFGNLAGATNLAAGLSNGTRGVIGGGVVSSSNTNVMQYITVATTGNTTDFGDLTEYRAYLAALSNDTRGVFAGGRASSGTNVMDYITIANTGNATDFGDLLNQPELLTGAGGSTRGIFAGGYDWGVADDAVNTIQYITIANTGNATDFGDLLAAQYGMGGLSNETRCVFSGGHASGNVNVIQYITTDTTGNATDFGDLTSARTRSSGAANGTRGVFGGGNTSHLSASHVDIIEYITIASTGNATDFGNLTEAKENTAGLSGT